MKKDNKFLSFISKFALPTLILLFLVSLATVFAITTSTGSIGAVSKYPGAFATLFNPGLYPASEHPAYATGIILNNIVAYAFALSAVVLFVLSLVLIKHNDGLKIKSALLSIFLLVPATLGLTGGFIDFIGHGMAALLGSGSAKAAIIAYLVVLVFILDILYYIFAIFYLIYAITTAVKVNKGELPVDEEEAIVSGGEEQEAGLAHLAEEDKAELNEKSDARKEEILEGVRKIVREELDRLDRIAIVTEEAAPAEEEDEEEEEEEPEEEPAEEAAPSRGPSAPRIPFAKKIVKADKEIQEKYNELKNDFLAYGASSRLSIAGDTFRLHRKPYVKITLVGKTLKVYFALNPADFNDSPIPVIDASDKASYVEVPALLKVKSNLSVRRAKDLAAMAFAADNIEQEEDVGNHNYVKDIRAELRAANKQ